MSILSSQHHKGYKASKSLGRLPFKGLDPSVLLSDLRKCGVDRNLNLRHRYPSKRGDLIYENVKQYGGIFWHILPHFSERNCATVSLVRFLSNTPSSSTKLQQNAVFTSLGSLTISILSKPECCICQVAEFSVARIVEQIIANSRTRTFDGVKVQIENDSSEDNCSENHDNIYIENEESEHWSLSDHPEFDTLFFRAQTYNVLTKPTFSGYDSNSIECQDDVLTDHNLDALQNTGVTVKISIRHVDISKDPVLDTLHGSQIPVVLIQQTELSRLKVDGPAIRKGINDEILRLVKCYKIRLNQ